MFKAKLLHSSRFSVKRKVSSLIKSSCANYESGRCLWHDCDCVQLNSMESLMDNGFITCLYFKNAVLPADTGLELALQQQYSKGKQCIRCKQYYLPTGKHQKYCIKCKDVERHRKEAARLRNLRCRKAG